MTNSPLRCAFVSENGARCQKPIDRPDGHLCFVHEARERKDRERAPSYGGGPLGLGRERSFEQVSFDVLDVPRPRSRSVGSALVIDTCTPSDPCLACDRCTTAMDEDRGAFA